MCGRRGGAVFSAHSGNRTAAASSPLRRWLAAVCLFCIVCRRLSSMILLKTQISSQLLTPTKWEEPHPQQPQVHGVLNEYTVLIINKDYSCSHGGACKVKMEINKVLSKAQLFCLGRGYTLIDGSLPTRGFNTPQTNECRRDNHNIRRSISAIASCDGTGPIIASLSESGSSASFISPCFSGSKVTRSPSSSTLPNY